MTNFVFKFLDFYNTNDTLVSLKEFVLSLEDKTKILTEKGTVSKLNKTKDIILDLAIKDKEKELQIFVSNITSYYGYDFNFREYEVKYLAAKQFLEVTINACNDSLEWGVMPKYIEELEKRYTKKTIRGLT
mgnify:FL=1